MPLALCLHSKRTTYALLTNLCHMLCHIHCHVSPRLVCSLTIHASHSGPCSRRFSFFFFPMVSSLPASPFTLSLCVCSFSRCLFALSVFIHSPCLSLCHHPLSVTFYILSVAFFSLSLCLSIYLLFFLPDILPQDFTAFYWPQITRTLPSHQSRTRHRTHGVT